jgi:hypothetical protein
MNRRDAIMGMITIPTLLINSNDTILKSSDLRDGQLIMVNLHGKLTIFKVDGQKLYILSKFGAGDKRRGQTTGFFLPRKHLDSFDWWIVDANGVRQELS